MTLEEAAKAAGREVVYLPARLHGRRESGVIVSVNDTFVFVRWGANQHSAATRPEEISFEVTSALRT